MAEATIIVCDVCGKTPTDTIRITARGNNYAKDLCATHLAEVLLNARAPQRGRPRKSAVGPTPAQAPRRRGRPKVAQAAPAASGRKRGPITDPVLLQKRRDALAKARAARAAKRAAAK